MTKPTRGGRRWWRYKRTWFVGVPLLLVLGVVGLFVWGGLQPRPDGFSPSVPDPDAGADGRPVQYTVDARKLKEWVFFDFDRGGVVDSDFGSLDWDLAFRRTHVVTNSGVTNAAGAGGAFDLGEVAFETVEPPASVAYVVDAFGGEDEDEPENPAIGRWYSYSFVTHIVSDKPNVYLVRTGGGRDALVQFISYYCDNEDSGCVTFRYRLIDARS